ncbi:MAG: hypothetical protein IKK57_08255 [Clostridia bacterium]|nr:hypothetical protein [Clostridia bacterium]
MADPKKSQSGGGFNPIGLCIGLGVGLCFGTAMDNIGLGICLGMGVGLCYSVALGHRTDSDDKPEDGSGEDKK